MCAHKNRKVRVIMDTQQIIETAEEKLIHTYNRYQIVLDKGDGVRLYDTDGKEYLDFGAGIAVFALGYNNKEYNDALKAQIDKLIHTSNYFYNEPAVEAATALTKASGMDTADELTGLIGACAIMLPSKSVQDLEVKSLKKKFKNKKFAAGCSRDVITSGAELLDWDLDTLFERTLAAMKASGNVD